MDGAEERIATAIIAEDGIADLFDLPAGSYRLHLSDGYASMPVRIPADRDLRFEPMTADALSVRIGNEEGWLARAGFRDGDRIVAISGPGGVPAEGTPDARRLRVALVQALAAGEGELWIERDGEDLRLPVPSDGLPVPSRLGGSLEPDYRGGEP